MTLGVTGKLDILIVTGIDNEIVSFCCVSDTQFPLVSLLKTVAWSVSEDSRNPHC